MVDTNLIREAVTVAHIQSLLIANTRGWLTTYPHMSVSYSRLATLIHEIVIVYTAALRAINDELRQELDEFRGQLGKDA